jgi:CrcB protein
MSVAVEVRQAVVLGAVSVGGVVGALARYGLGLAVPHTPTGFPVSTLIINVAGSLFVGALMVALGHLRDPHPLIRPFVGIGILGGFTTFSTYVVDAQQLIVHHEAGSAILYLVSTLVLGLAAVAVGGVLTRLVLTRAVR